MPDFAVSHLYNPDMAAKPKPRGPWTAEEVARNEFANRARALHDRGKTPEQRLEETLRLSRFVSELSQGSDGRHDSAPSHARALSTPRGPHP